MKKSLFVIGILVSFALISCNGNSKKDENKDKKEEVFCEVENDISIRLKNYMYQMSDTLELNIDKFEVKSSEYTWINDSTISLKLLNYDKSEMLAERTEDQIDILVEIGTRDGKKLEEAYYGYHEYESGRWAGVKLITAYGSVYFNWVAGMPETGGVTIEHIGKDDICGTFSLNTEKPDDPVMGIVKLNGTFVHKKEK